MTIGTLLLIWAGLTLACLIYVGINLLRAPVGYEDEDGFHPGRPPPPEEDVARGEDEAA